MTHLTLVAWIALALVADFGLAILVGAMIGRGHPRSLAVAACPIGALGSTVAPARAMMYPTNVNHFASKASRAGAAYPENAPHDHQFHDRMGDGRR